MTTTLQERLRESLRLIILTLLGAVESRRVDSRTLAMALRDMGHETAREPLESELRWLERQGLVTLERPVAATLVIALTEKGDQAQRGVVEEPGVARPALG